MFASKARKGMVVFFAVVFLLMVLTACNAFATEEDQQQGENSVSNGEQIYFTATSQRNTPIESELPGGGMMEEMMTGAIACADCHRQDGRGGELQFMMSSVEVPDIRWETLTAENGHGAEDEEEDEHGEEEHPPYTEETLKQAITEGVNPAGEPLQWPMPLWQMNEADLDDLIAFLKTL